MPDPNLTALKNVQKTVKVQQDKRDKAIADLANANAEIARVTAEAARLEAAGDIIGAQRQRAALDPLVTKRRNANTAISDTAAAVTGALDGLRDLVDPCDADPAFPLLLLPVRVETRFSPDGKSLRIRIMPDDIHIDQLDHGLSNAERDAATIYWHALWTAADDALDPPWQVLVNAVGKQRAAWAALAMEPTNLNQRATAAAPVFPDVSARTKRAAVARLLPDHFTAVANQAGSQSRKTGASIPPELVVGLFAGDGSEYKEVSGLQFLPGAEWLADYGAAEKNGMAITLPLASAGQKIDDLFVFGVRRSIDPKRAPAEFEDLLTAHLCTKGLAFVPQGAPSNNTETDRAAWQRRPDMRQPPRDAVNLDPGSNAAVLSAALGISTSLLSGLDYAGTREQALAKAMNVALWGPSWGTFLDRANNVDASGSTLTTAMREQARIFHRDFVRGRGPLPTLRIGAQPYGVLPVSSIGRRWKSARGDTFENNIAGLLQRLRRKWLGCVDDLPRVGTGAIDEVIGKLLGTSPVSVSLRVRTVLSAELALLATKAAGASQADLDLESLIETVLVEDLIGNLSFIRPMGSLSEDSRPLALPYVDDARDGAVIGQIVADQAPQISSVLQALAALAWDRAKRELNDSSGQGRLNDIIQATTSMSPQIKNDVATLVARPDSASADQYYAVATTVLAANQTATVPDIAEVQPVTAYRSSFAQLALESTADVSRDYFGVITAAAWALASGRLAELKTALTELSAALSPDALPGERRILVAETLDTASHRLDAWLTGLVERRRQSLRKANPIGLSVGAYGWVQEITRAADQNGGNGGYIAAPSLDHAATAGILRSAYLSHNPDAGGNNAFAIDLTSERVRTALHLLDGIRQGQPLGALLGYRLERKIHEAGLDRLILSLRAIAPLTQGKLTDRSDGTDIPAVEALAAANVTDGLQLAEKYQGKVANWNKLAVLRRLNDRPTNNPYLIGDWPVLSPEEWRAVSAIIEDAGQAADAVADLLMAESVHQMVQGNMPRASAALDAASTGDVPPPEPDVVASRLEGIPRVHRLMLVAGGDGGWNSTRPRSAAAPLLEAWSGARLGSPATIRIGSNIHGAVLTAADTGLSALDLVYMATDRPNFERVLRANLPALAPDAALFAEPADDWPADQRAIGNIFDLAASMRALLVASRPATAADLAVPNTPPVRSIDPTELDLVKTRLQAATGMLSLRAQAAAAQLSVNPVVHELLASALAGLADFGIVLPQLQGDAIINAGHLVLADANKRLTEAEQALGDPASITAESLAKIGQSLFGDGFWVTPRVGSPSGPDAWGRSVGATPLITQPTHFAIRRYLTDMASVRDNVRRYLEILMLGEATGTPAAPRATQMTGIGDDPPTTWIGVALDPSQPTPLVPLVSTVLDTVTAYDGSAETLALVIDEWTEVVPLRERRSKEPDTPVDIRATAGIAVNANAPGARAPQAMLLAISPDGNRWTTDAMVDLLAETLELAKIRAVTLETTNGAARILPALYQRSWSLQGEKVLDLRFIAEKAYNKAAVAAFVKDKGP
ncbi:hypothetical protein GFPCMMHI_01129 [Ensifer adhaerens]|nr:hypothetical protein [Ensifer adhaerens]